MSICTDCLEQCNGKVFSDRCILYTGEDIDALGICQGDTINQVEKIIIDKIIEFTQGNGITLAEVTLENCPHLLEAFGDQDKTLTNLFQLLIDQHCTLKELVDELEEEINTNFVFDFKCLDVDGEATRDEIIQALIDTVCDIKTIVDALPTTYVKLSDLETLVNNIINNTSIQYYSFIPPKVAFAYFGSLSNFDSTGKGLIAAGMENIYLCNGQNGTPDLRGRAVIGAVRNVPGGSLDSAVDPSLLSNPNTNYGVLDKFGASYHTLTTSQMPAHSHTVTDPGHVHNMDPNFHYHGTQAGGMIGSHERSNPATRQTNSATTGITIGSAGSGLAHENRQPSIAAYWIMRI